MQLDQASLLLTRIAALDYRTVYTACAPGYVIGSIAAGLLLRSPAVRSESHGGWRRVARTGFAGNLLLTVIDVIGLAALGSMWMVIAGFMTGTGQESLNTRAAGLIIVVVVQCVIRASVDNLLQARYDPTGPSQRSFRFLLFWNGVVVVSGLTGFLSWCKNCCEMRGL